jgi:hypothetical protein
MAFKCPCINNTIINTSLLTPPPQVYTIHVIETNLEIVNTYVEIVNTYEKIGTIRQVRVVATLQSYMLTFVVLSVLHY